MMGVQCPEGEGRALHTGIGEQCGTKGSRPEPDQPAPGAAQSRAIDDAMGEHYRRLGAVQQHFAREREFEPAQADERGLIETHTGELLTQRLDAKRSAPVLHALCEGAAVGEPWAECAGSRRYAGKPTGVRG